MFCYDFHNQVLIMVLLKEQLLEINREMISLGKPILKDFMGYNKPDYAICQKYLSHLDDEDAYDLIKRLKKYKKRQLIDYSDNIAETLKYYNQNYKKGKRNLFYKRAKKKKFVDISFQEKYAIAYIPEIPNGLIGCLNYINKESKLVNIDYEDLFSIMKILNLYGYTIKKNVWKELGDKKLRKVSTGYDSLLFDLKEQVKEDERKQKEKELIYEMIKNSNERLIKDNVEYIEIVEDNKDEQLLTLNYPRKLISLRHKGDVYEILKSLNYSSRVYFQEHETYGNFKLRYKGVKSFINEIEIYNINADIKINCDCLVSYKNLVSNALKISVEVNNSNNTYYDLKFPYNDKVINTIKSLSNNLRTWDSYSKAWSIKGIAIPTLYLQLKDILVNDELLDLSDFEKIINLDDLNNQKIKFSMEYINGVRGNSKYRIIFNMYNKEIEGVLKKYYIPSKNEVIAYLSDFETILFALKGIKELDIDTQLIEDAISNYKNDISNKTYQMISLDNLNRKPLDHQIPAINRMLDLKRFILGDDMGIGKTYESIVWGLSLPFKKLIICPKSLKLNWKKEILQVSPNEEVVVMKSNKYKPLTTNTGWLILNYDLLKKHIENITKEGFKVLCIDEAHFIKSVKMGGIPNSSRAKSCLDLTTQIPYKAMITGTPITNKTKDLWNLLVAIEHPLAQDFYYFINRYCDAQSNGYGYVFDGASNQKELYEQLQPYMIRRLKGEVLNLPPKIRSFIPNEIKLSAYNKKLNEYLKKSKGYMSDAQHLVYLNALRVVLAEEKIPSTIELCENILEQGEPVAIYTNYSKPIENIKKYFGDNAVVVDGSVSEKERDLAVEKFQNGEVNVFIGNMKAAGVGITLTRANNLIFNDYDWIPSNHSQAEDRLHRISQNAITNIYYNYASNADVDAYMTNIIEEKLKNISLIVDGKEDNFIAEEKSKESIFKELLKVLNIENEESHEEIEVIN